MRSSHCEEDKWISTPRLPGDRVDRRVLLRSPGRRRRGASNVENSPAAVSRNAAATLSREHLAHMQDEAQVAASQMVVGAASASSQEST